MMGLPVSILELFGNNKKLLFSFLSNRKECSPKINQGLLDFSNNDKTVANNKLDVESVNKLRKKLKLKLLKNGGTTIKNDSEKYNYCYDPTDTAINPYTTLCDNSKDGYSIELFLNPGSSCIFIQDLPISYHDVYNLAYNNNANTTMHASSFTNNGEGPNSVYDIPAVVVSGKIRIEIKKPIKNKKIFLKSLKIHLKCFTNEYGCLVDFSKSSNPKGVKKIDILNNSKTKYKPTVNLEISDCTKTYLKLEKNIYEFPFEFKITDNKFPATNSSYYGSTIYRIESFIKIIKIGKTEKTTDTVILTDKLSIKRVVPVDSFYLNTEQVKSSGNWSRFNDKHNRYKYKSMPYPNHNDEINYEVLLSSRMLQIANFENKEESEFQLKFNIINNFKNFKFEKVSIIFAQFTSIPTLNVSTLEPLETAFIKKTEIELATQSFERNCSDHINLEFKNLLIYDGNSIQFKKNLENVSKWYQFSLIRPFYCERSSLFPNIAGLKITHKIVIKLKFSPIFKEQDVFKDDIDKMRANLPTILSFSIPVILVDKDMLSSLFLPKYIRESNTTLTPLLSFQDELPLYSELTV